MPPSHRAAMSSAPHRLFPSFDTAFLGGPGRSLDPHDEADRAAPEPVYDQPTVSLEDLNFSDLYINVDKVEDRSFYRVGPNSENLSGLFPVPPEYDEHIGFVRALIDKHDRPGGILTLGTMRLRFQKAAMSDGYTRSAIRRIPIDLPQLDELSMNPEGVKALRRWGRARGIVAIGGATGNGKTTTAVGILNEYLSRLGGVAITVEDPPEYLMQGWIGDKGGHCDQILIESDSEWESAVNTALRWRPRYILFGEIRTPEAAGQALRASTSGHLVLATVHGGSTDEALGTLLRLAEVNMGDGARKLLAYNLTGVVYQRLTKYGPDLDVLTLPRGGSEEAAVRKILQDPGSPSLASYVKSYPALRD